MSDEERSFERVRNKMPSALLIGDPHFRPGNVSIIEKFVDKAEMIASKLCPTFIVILGDILHTHEKVYTEAYNRACDFIERMSEIAPTFVLIGNHDYISNSQFLSDKHPFNPLKKWDNVTIVDHVVEAKINKRYFIFVPYVPPGRLVEALDEKCEKDWHKATCIFAHQEFHGAKMGAFQSEIGDKWDGNWPLVFSGHIHETQKVGDNIFYTGSAIQHAFGDTPNKTLAHVYFTKNKGLIRTPDHFRGETIYQNKYVCFYEKVPLELPKKQTIHMPLSEVNDFNTDEKSEDKIRLVVTGDVEHFKAFKKSRKSLELQKKGVKVVFYHPKSSRKTNQEVAKLVGKNKQSYHQILKAIIDKEHTGVKDAYVELFGEMTLSAQKRKPVLENIDDELSEVSGDEELSADEDQQ